jgi:hypothetical protein
MIVPPTDTGCDGLRNEERGIPWQEHRALMHDVELRNDANRFPLQRHFHGPIGVDHAAGGRQVSK